MRSKFYFIKRSVKYFFQRLFRGWDDSETWNLDQSLSRLILPRLKRYRELYCKSTAETVDKMIYSFEYLASEKCYEYNPEEDEKVQEGLNLFAEHYRSLWD